MNTTNQTSTSAQPMVKGPSPLLDQLRDKIRQVETAGRSGADSYVASGCPAIDRLLPGPGYSRGALVQWLTAGGGGADFLSLRVAQNACEEGGALVVIDPENEFFPPAAASLGINLNNLIILRTGQPRGSTTPVAPLSQPSPATAQSTSISTATSNNDLLWAIDQAIRCPAVAAVWGPLPEINERWFRRFQLSAESSGCMGLFIQPTRNVKIYEEPVSTALFPAEAF